MTEWEWVELGGTKVILAQSFGIVPPDSGWGPKWLFETSNRVTNALGDVINKMRQHELLEYREEPDYEVRWNEQGPIQFPPLSPGELPPEIVP